MRASYQKHLGELTDLGSLGIPKESIAYSVSLNVLMCGWAQDFERSRSRYVDVLAKPHHGKGIFAKRTSKVDIVASVKSEQRLEVLLLLGVIVLVVVALLCCF